MISEHFDPVVFLETVHHFDLLRLRAAAEEELRWADLACCREWTTRAPRIAAPHRYIRFLTGLLRWLETGGGRMQVSPDVGRAWCALAERLVATGQLGSGAIHAIRRRAEQRSGQSVVATATSAKRRRRRGP